MAQIGNHIGIVIACNYGFFPKEFLISLIEMQQYFYEWCITFKREDKLSLFIQGGYNLDEMRNHSVKNALEYNVTHLLFLDTDMAFPRQMIVTMIKDLEENEKWGIEAITGLYVRKEKPFLPHVYPKYIKKSGKFAICGKFPMNSLFKVEGAGCGCLMVKDNVFRRVNEPWFKFVGKVKKAKTGVIPINVGEDLYFCLKAKPLILCDTRLVCKHFGMTNFDINNYIEYNGLKKIKNGFKVTKKQIKEIGKKYSQRHLLIQN